MSDGWAPYPEVGVKKFLEDQKIYGKTKIYTVPFGKSADKTVLQKIANAFPKGNLIDAPTPEALGKSFLKIIPNIYY